MQSLPLLGTTVAEKYRIERLLGEGGMGAVFQAHHELIGKRVALKWLHPIHSREAESQKRLLREARASARIHHPNVVEVYDVGVHEGNFFIVMELVDGESFEDLLRRGGISVATALHILMGAMRGAAEAHRCGIIHRDLKLENIFVVRGPGANSGTIAKVLDFGVSKLVEDRQPSALVTQTGHTMGTPMYMSVEQMHAQRDIDHRTDIYSLGVCMYRALTGTFPFGGETFAAVAVEMATRRPKSPRQLHPELPAALDRIVMRAMAYDRASRYASLQELIDALAQVLTTNSALSTIRCRVIRPREQAPRSEASSAPSGKPAPFEVQPHVLRASTGGATWHMRTGGEQPIKRRRWPLVVLSVGLGLAGALLVRGSERSERAPTSESEPPKSPAIAAPAAAPAEAPSSQKPAAGAPTSIARPAPPLIAPLAPIATPSPRAPAAIAHPPREDSAAQPAAAAPEAPEKPGDVGPTADAAVAKPASAPEKVAPLPKRESAAPSRTATGRRSGTLRLEELTQ